MNPADKTVPPADEEVPASYLPAAELGETDGMKWLHMKLKRRKGRFSPLQGENSC
jgi:hypothetical protein